MANRFERYAVGPLVTFALTVVVRVASVYEGYTFSLALPFIGLAFSAFYGGLFSNILSAVVIIGFTIIETNYDPVRSSQVIISALSIAFINGLLKRRLRVRILEAESNRRKAELVDTLNGNVSRFIKALNTLDALQRNWDVYTPARRKQMVEDTHDGLADLITSVQGWKEMADNRRLVIEQMDKGKGE